MLSPTQFKNKKQNREKNMRAIIAKAIITTSAVIFISAAANAADITILVGTKKSEAYQFAKSKADKKNGLLCQILKQSV
jgi:hypothetical protein